MKTLWLVLLLILITGMAGSAGFFALNLQESLEDYTPVYVNDQARLKAQMGQSGASKGTAEWVGATEGHGRLSERLVLVVIDGLRADVSEKMPYLNELRSRGAYGTVRTGQPSYSKPGYSVISSGAWQEINGVTLNSHTGTMAADNIFASAQRSDLSTAAIADDWWLEVNGPVFTYQYFYPDSESHDPATDEKAYSDALHTLRQDRADLTLIHFCQVDTQAHETGGAKTGEYLDAALHIDGFLKDIASELDLSKDTLIVTSDHGHLWSNNFGGSGHGGWEVEVTTSPLVMVGAGISPGELGQSRQVDVTATVSALLGIQPPAQSQGRILWEALSASPMDKAANQIRRAGTYKDFANEYVRAADLVPVGRDVASEKDSKKKSEEVLALEDSQKRLEAATSAFVSGAYEKAFDEAAASFELAHDAVDRMREGRIARERIPRSIAAFAYLVLTLLLASRVNKVFRTAFFAGGFLSVALGLCAYLYVFGNAFSLSVFPDAGMATFVKIFGIPIWVALGVVYVIGAIYLAIVQPRGSGWRPVGWGSRRISLFDRVLQTEFLVLGTMYYLSLLVAVAIAINGLRITWYLPDFRTGFLGMYAALQTALLAPAAVLLPIVTLVGAGIRAVFSRQLPTFVR